MLNRLSLYTVTLLFLSPSTENNILNIITRLQILLLLIDAFVVVVVVVVVNVDFPHHQHLTRIFGVCNYWNNKKYQLNIPVKNLPIKENYRMSMVIRKLNIIKIIFNIKLLFILVLFVANIFLILAAHLESDNPRNQALYEPSLKAVLSNQPAIRILAARDRFISIGTAHRDGLTFNHKQEKAIEHWIRSNMAK